MCGRFVLDTLPDLLRDQFRLAEMDFAPEPRFNIAPTQPLAAVLDRRGGRALTALRWGLVPHWAKDAALGGKLFNARSETAAEKPSFRAAFKYRRCLVPATGFYEWRKADSGKVPTFISFEGGAPFAIAALWEAWTAPDGSELHSAALLTTSANAFMAPIHDRMPVVLPPAAHDEWLDPANRDVAALSRLMAPCDPAPMRAWAVSTRVNSPRNQGPELAAPV